MKQSFKPLSTGPLHLSKKERARLHAEFEAAFINISLEAVDRANGSEPRETTVKVDLGAPGTFSATLPVPNGNPIELSRLFGTAEPKTRRALRGLYLEGNLEGTGQPIRLLRLPDGQFGLVALDQLN